MATEKQELQEQIDFEIAEMRKSGTLIKVTQKLPDTFKNQIAIHKFEERTGLEFQTC